MRGIMCFGPKATELHARKLIVFLGLHAGSAHPKRDQYRGQIQFGLQLCEVA